MHELAVGQAIVDTVTAHAGGRPLRRVHVRIGYLRQVVPDALQFAWEILTNDSDLAGSELVIEHVPAVLTCRACGARTTLELPVLLCGACEGRDVEVSAGEEFEIAAIDVVEAVT